MSTSKARLQLFEQEAMSHLDVLLKAATGILRSRDAAEDAVQETYLRAWRYFDSFEPGSNCRGWLFRIMFNVVNASKGKQARLAEVPLDPEEGTEARADNVLSFDPLKRIEGHEVLEASKRLPEEQRAVLWLVVVEELSYREVADTLGIPIGTVMSRLHRGRRDLRKMLITGNERAAAEGG